MVNSALISAQALAEIYEDDTVRLLDASWALDGTDMATQFLYEHIPSAQFFDLEAVSDKLSGLPHMAPTPEMFADAVGRLGIHEHHHVIIYDRQGLFSAARIWWTFLLMGHRQIHILNGGLPAWRQAGFPVTEQMTVFAPEVYRPRFQAELIIDQDGVANAPEDQLIVDARPRVRFDGKVPEPRPGLRSGHIPGSYNIPYAEFISNGALKPVEDLKALFQPYDLSPHPVITTCGSGVTAAIIALALFETGRPFRLYDGSWAQWGRDDNNTPVVVG
jgi:thiosulfate/3-mercaptopyruvate sulfurtransferase